MILPGYAQYPTARDQAVGGLQAAWVTPRRYIARWRKDETSLLQFGLITAADFILTRWWPLSQLPVQGTWVQTASEDRPAFTYLQTVQLQANGVRFERRDMAERLQTGGDATLLVLDNNGRFWLIGEQAGGRFTWSTNTGDRGGRSVSSFEFRANQRTAACEVAAAVAEEWLAGDGGTYTPRADELARLNPLDFEAPAVTPFCLPILSGGSGIPCPPTPPPSAGARVYEVAVSGTSLSVPQGSHQFLKVGNVLVLNSSGQEVGTDINVDSSETVNITFNPSLTGKVRIMGA